MWPFKPKKEKEINLCINCEYIKPYDSRPYVCQRHKHFSSVEIDLTDGSKRIKESDNIIFCREFRMWGIFPWMCGKKGRFFKDKQRFS